MLSGLSNAPSIFSGYINKILAEKFDIFVIIYLDDILIYSKDLRQLYVEIVCQVLDQIQKYFFLKKCRFYQNEVCFLGYIVLSKRINMEAEKIEVIKDWPKFKSVLQYLGFLMLCQFLSAIYLRFQQNSSSTQLNIKNN